ncbi:RNA polymerase sigma factor [Aestuariibacter sp. A3R04]|uniref:RNA polymerase sigma factor n=1 Tax=Aestuariibacter sp. A3R04 TaxID=2841571 RepID=UPI001C0835A1|nr:RNA polymerase sigma factor [Aestuariibacter sp. A3R04]
MTLPPQQNQWQGLTDSEGRQARIALRSFILGLTNDSSVTDDVVQETIMRTSKSVRFSELENPLAYMITVAKSVLYDFQRKKLPNPVDYQSVALDAANDCPEQRYHDQRKLAFIEMVLADMSPLRREVFLLRRVDGLSRDAIARKLGLSVEGVKKHLTRAMVEITLKLEQAGWTDASV